MTSSSFIRFSTQPRPQCTQSKMRLAKSAPSSSTQVGAGLQREGCLERHGISVRHTATLRGPLRTLLSRSLLCGTRSPRKPSFTNSWCFHLARHQAFTASVGSLGHGPMCKLLSDGRVHCRVPVDRNLDHRTVLDSWLRVWRHHFHTMTSLTLTCGVRNTKFLASEKQSASGIFWTTRRNLGLVDVHSEWRAHETSGRNRQ